MDVTINRVTVKAEGAKEGGRVMLWCLNEDQE